MKKLRYDPMFRHHPVWLQLLWWILGFIIALAVGFALFLLKEKTSFLMNRNLSEVVDPIIVLISFGIGFVINYYLLFGIYMQFGNNDPNYEMKLKNKKARTDNRLFIKNIKKVVRDMNKAKNKNK